MALETHSADRLIAENHRLQEQLRDKDDAIVCAMSAMVDLKDLHTGTHSTRMAEWAVRIGRVLGLGSDELRDLELACLLHDVGKIGVPDAILLKPGRLTAEESAVVRRHPEFAWAILRMIPGFEQVALLVLHHHERMDGLGYPAGLAGDAIPVGSRIVAVIDAFDAMMSSRSYRGALPLHEALTELERWSGIQWDPHVVPLFAGIAKAEFDAVAASVGSPHGLQSDTEL